MRTPDHHPTNRKVSRLILKSGPLTYESETIDCIYPNGAQVVSRLIPGSIEWDQLCFPATSEAFETMDLNGDRISSK